MDTEEKKIEGRETWQMEEEDGEAHEYELLQINKLILTHITQT